MGVYVGHDECRVIYVAKNGLQLRVSSIWVGDQQVFPPANRQEPHFFTRDTQGYGRVDNGTHFAFAVPVPWWAASMDVVLIGAGEKGRDGTKSFTGGSDGAGGKSGAWVVKTLALTQSTEAVVRVGKGTSTSPHATEMILPGVGGQADVRVHDGEGTRTPNSGSTGGTPSPQTRTDYGDNHQSAAGGARNNAGGHPGGGGGGGQGSGLIGNPTTGRNGGDGYVWLRFRSDAPIGGGGFTLRVGVTSGWAYNPLREWAVSIGKTYQTITEITVPIEVIGPSLYSLFYDCQALERVPEFDTSQVTNMEFMFYDCSSLTSVPALDTHQVTDMQFMFYDCSSLTSVPALDTHQVTNMYGMFQNCHALTTIPALDTSNVTTMYAMFTNCTSLASVPDLDTSQVTDMQYMFYDCSSLTSVPALDTSQVTNMYAMFQGGSSLTSVPDLDTSQVTNMGAMFTYCQALTTIPALNTSQVTNMGATFYDCQALTTIPALNTSQVTNTGFMFQGCSSLESVTLPGMGNGFTTRQTLGMVDTKLSAAAANALMQSLGTVPAAANGTKLELPATATGANANIATAKNWQVTIGDEMVVLRVGVTSGAAYAPLREWAVGIGKTYQTITEITVPMEVIAPSLQALFDGCSSLTSVPALNTSQVTNMRLMFNGCSSLASVPALDTSQVTTMRSMFYDCSSLTSVPALDTSQVTDMYAMFVGCSSLTSIPALNTSQVTDTSDMFWGCSALETVTLPGMGNGFTTNQTLNMKATKLNTAAANALMQSLGTPPPGGTLQLPATAAGADVSIATTKNWTVTIA